MRIMLDIIEPLNFSAELVSGASHFVLNQKEIGWEKNYKNLIKSLDARVARRPTGDRRNFLFIFKTIKERWRKIHIWMLKQTICENNREKGRN